MHGFIKEIINLVYLAYLIIELLLYISSDIYGRKEFSFASFIIPETVTIISGIVFLGLSEVINLLQRKNQMLWVAKTNNIIACAGEIVMSEVVYV